MCGGCFAPPLALIPLLVVIEGFNHGVAGLKSMDEAIRRNNLRIYQLLNKKKNKFGHSSSDQLEQKSTYSIQEIRSTLSSSPLSENEKEEMSKLLIQRCVARLEMKEFSLAKDDLIEAMTFMKKTTTGSGGGTFSSLYLAEYLMGLCCGGMSEFSEAAQHFQKAIEQLEKCKEILGAGDDFEQKMAKMEEEFFSMQLETKNVLEKGAASWNKNFTQFSTNVSNMTNMAKNFYNHNLMLGSDKPVLKPKPSGSLTPELLYIRAGISYYSGTYYTDAIPFLSRAIEIGKGYESEHVESTYFNRGLCYYYMGELKLALDDFSKSISLMPLLKQREQPYQMRAATYGRLGMTKERDSDLARVKLVNPFSKPSPLFHLRLLNEDSLCHIMSFLQTKQILVMSSLDKYCRGLVTHFLQEFDIEIGKASLVNAYREDRRSIAEKIFLPKVVVNYYDMFDNIQFTMNHPLLVEHAKNLILYSNGLNLKQSAIEKYKNLKRLTIDIPNYNDYSTNNNNYLDEASTLIQNSPNLTYLCIASNYYVLNHYYTYLTKFTSIEHLRVSKVFFSKNPFEKMVNLKRVEYTPIDDESDKKFYTENNPNKTATHVLTWDEIKNLNPTITFVEHHVTLNLYESDY